MAIAKVNTFGLVQTNGMFKAFGVVSGVDKDSFYKELSTRNNKQMRMINFGLEYDKGKTIYISLNGIERDYVYFSAKGSDGKNITEKVSWNARKSFNKEGFSPIGVKIGLMKKVNEKGKTINDTNNYTEYDACEYIADNLRDGMSIFVMGKIEFSTFNGKHQTKFVPNQISLCPEIDFDSGKPFTCDFEQVVVYNSIEKTDNYYTLTANIVTYNTVEDAEFIVENPTLAKNIKSLKPYTAFKSNGRVIVETSTEVVEEDDGWGTTSSFNKISSPTVRKLVITGVDPDTIDTTLYSESEIENAIAQMNRKNAADSDFGSSTTKDNDGWGTTSSASKSPIDDDDEWD